MKPILQLNGYYHLPYWANRPYSSFIEAYAHIISDKHRRLRSMVTSNTNILGYVLQIKSEEIYHAPHGIPNLTWLSFCWRLMLSQAKNITTNIEKQCLQKNKLRLIVTKRLHNKIVLEICLGLKTFQTRCKYLKGKLCEMMGPWRKNCLHNQGYSFETQYPNFVPIQYSSKYMVWT